MTQQVRVSVVQAAPVFFNKEATIEKAAGLIKQAAEEGAKLVMFPESFIPGYPRAADFGSGHGRHTESERKLFRQYFENSITDNGPEAGRLSELAKAHQVYLAMGLTEKEGASLFCSVFFWGPGGEFLGKHRKLKPTGFERLIWTQGDGSILTAVDTPFGKMGAVICWENYMPLLRAAMYAKGISLYLAPTADSHPHWWSTIQHIALEGRCFVLACNQYLPDDEGDENSGERDLKCKGGSAIVSPMGEFLAGPLQGREGILTVDLDMGLIYEARYDFDPVGHFARPDVFTLIVDERPQKGAEFK